MAEAAPASAVSLGMKLGGIAALNVVFTFGFQWFVLTRLGPGVQSDALFAATMVPQLVLVVLSGSLTHVLVPLLSTTEDAFTHSDSWMFFQGAALIFGGAAIVLALAASLWVPLTVPGFTDLQTVLTVHLVRIQLVGMVLSACAAVLWSSAYARHAFTRAEVSPVVAWAIAMLFVAVTLPTFGVAAAAWGLVVKQLVQVLLMLPVLGPYRRPDFRSAAAIEARRRMVPLILGTTYYKTDQLLDRLLASLAPAGSLSLFHLSSQIYSASHLVLNTAVAAPAVPRLTVAAHEHRWGAFRTMFQRRLVGILAVTIGGLVVLALAGRPILTFLFGHGQFDAEELHSLWIILLALGGALVAGAAGQIMASSYYAMGNTRTPTRVGMATYTVGIPLKIGGFMWGGIIGLALATSVYYLITLVVLYAVLNRDVLSQRATDLQPAAEA